MEGPASNQAAWPRPGELELGMRWGAQQGKGRAGWNRSARRIGDVVGPDAAPGPHRSMEPRKTAEFTVRGHA